MWSQLLLCCLVGFAAASDYGWKSNTEYLYKVQGRTLTGLPDVANQYAGIVMSANLIVRPQGDGKLVAKISDAKYAQVHTQLPQGWRSEIPESKLNFQQLQLSDKPFEIVMKNGVVRDVIVSKEVHNWEANLLKSIISQIQLDTQGQHAIKSHINQLPQEGSNNAVFKTMEDTVTGKYETLYDITPLPEYILQSQPWLVPMPQMKGDGEFIEIVKSKNFSRGEERVGYHFGLGANGKWEPNTNHMGEFFLRSSLSRAVISGNLKRYTIQSAVTTNKIILSPSLNSEQKGMVVSHLNLTLTHVQPASSQFQKIQEPQQLGSLVYRYGSPFSSNHEARPGQQRQEQEEYDFSSEEMQHQKRHYRHRRSANSAEQEFDSPEFEDSWTQEEPKLSSAPETPLLPMHIGNKGKSIKSAQNVNIVEAAEKLAQQIGQEIQRPEKIQKEQTLSKFILLTNLLRLMNEKEMQEVSRQIYNKESKGPKADAWKSFRDAVATCGTGPALLTIKEWIKTKKIEQQEAAEVIAVLAKSARHPTPEYMRTFYALVTDEDVKSQQVLAETAILSFSKLVCRVYNDKEVSHNQYPVHTFGSFRKEGKQFVVQEFIPYLKQKLNQAVEKADSRKVLVNIRALGYVAHPKILAAFEPYLEGEKQVSQFQRFNMILSLRKLVDVHPKIARSVLYKIYQNAGEEPVVRVAAVFLLMRTCPPASMLQRMAQYTNIDTSNQVNAAVKSAIESATKLEGEQYAQLKENSEAAQPLLTKENFGIQYSRNFLRSFVNREMNLFYKQNIQIYGNEESSLPNGIKSMLRSELNGFNTEIFDIEAMVSSIDELTNVLKQQTEIHQHEQKQQKQNYKQAQQNQWSSEHIARLLNIQTEEREQLEGNFLFEFGVIANRFMAFDNRTVELLPSVIRDIEQHLRDGKDYHLCKFYDTKQVTISFPTEMSLPFVYTLHTPTLFHVKGQIRASAEPQISSGDKIHKPHTINGETELHALFSTKVQTKIGFVAPFEHHSYVSGFDRNIQVNIPLKAQIEVDIKNKQMNAQLQPVEPEKNTQVFHYSTYPYTAKKDLLKVQPIVKSQNVHVIRAPESEQTRFQSVVGKKIGMAFRVGYTSDQQFMDTKWLLEQLRRQDRVTALMAIYNDETIQYKKMEIEYAGAESTVRKVQFRMGYESRYESEHGNESNGPSAEISQFSQLPNESKARKQQFAKMAAAGIQSANVRVVDASIEFDGQNKIEYTATAAIASSPVDQKARALCYIRKQSANPQENRPFQFAVSAKAQVPNTNGLDFAHALKFDPTSTVQIEVAAGEDLKSASKVHVQAKLRKSESRKQYLQSLQRAHECRREMEEGNHQLPACANMTAEANLMDRVQVQLQFEHVSSEAAECSRRAYDYLRYLGFYNLRENLHKQSGKQNEIEMEARFEPNFESVNVTIKSEHMESKFEQIRVNHWAKQVVAVHPVFPMTNRVMGKLLQLDTYRPICVVDKTAANTFDNKTYPIDLGHAWTVMFQYVPTFARQQQNQPQRYQQQQEEQQTEQYVVLVRDTKSGQAEKEVRMTIRTPETQGQLIDLEIKPSENKDCSKSNPCAKVQVNGKQYEISDAKSTDIQGGFIKFFALPSGEIKVTVRDSFYIIYDGKRVKLAVVSDKFRGSVRGLCGTFTGEQSDDFLTPKNCILRNPREFAATYAIEEQGHVQQYKSRAQKAECFYKDNVYANVISDFDAGRNHQQYTQKQNYLGQRNSDNSCSKQQTSYMLENNGETICFTTHKIPVCKSSCNANELITKSVKYHCVPKTNISELWRNQINKGASPDFSSKTVTKTVEMKVPASCSRY
ncbi:PREDICTED: vitellogenin-like [Nicrophorus vespilloides]|uniref:Vitellogenin-like n=2 Tax=Nicrophorus vespilloides TaxID=110193 RepID=A0ABM1N2G7_NICVS|nr:PREDICTED: vitellogenin-like [Nicrophorus vespilloides]